MQFKMYKMDEDSQYDAEILDMLKKLSKKLEINEAAAFGFFSTLATNITTFEAMKKMDEKGVVLNSAFAISAAFTFAGHLAFVLSFNSEYILCSIIGKLTAGLLAVVLANIAYKRVEL